MNPCGLCLEDHISVRVRGLWICGDGQLERRCERADAARGVRESRFGL